MRASRRRTSAVIATLITMFALAAIADVLRAEIAQPGACEVATTVYEYGQA